MATPAGGQGDMGELSALLRRKGELLSERGDVAANIDGPGAMRALARVDSQIERIDELIRANRLAPPTARSAA